MSRGKVLFADPKFIRNAVEFALKIGNDPIQMKAKPGKVMGYLAYGHPFLDGNGRTIMVVHCVLAQRAGFSIDWAATEKNAYLAALANELDDPGKGVLDGFLRPFMRSAVADLSKHIAAAKGPGGGTVDTDKVYGRNDDPAVQAQYKQQQLKREQQRSSE